jgi:RNA-directed DNA polymerase
MGKHRTRTYRGKPGYKTFIKPSRKALQRHRDKLRDIIQHHRGAPQAGLVYALNPVIQGWANYYQYCVAKRDFQILDNTLYHQLTRWARYRHPRKSGKWCYHRYWRKVNGRVRFSDGESVLSFHQTTTVSRFVKVQGDKSPGACPERGRRDGDWVYWSTRLGRDPNKPRRVTRLLKRQRGCCALCGLRFTTEDVIEVHHHDRNHNHNAFDNLRLMHGHCHDIVHGTRCL